MVRLPTEAPPRRAWFLSPALATVIFFAVQVALSFLGSQPNPGMAGLAPRTPQAQRGERVQHRIEPADPVERDVPSESGALLRLLESNARVRFRVNPPTD
jgi:hypothetical protein